jgi:ribonuclease P protein component
MMSKSTGITGKPKHEACLSAIEQKTEEQGGLSCPHGHAGRAGGSGAPPPQGARPSDARLSAAAGLPRALRLRRADDFQDAFAQQRAFRGRFLVLYVRAAPDAARRLGVAAGKRTFRRAVDRARAKRLLREAFRLNRVRFQAQADVLLLARRAILDVKRPDVEADLLKVAKRAGLL